MQPSQPAANWELRLYSRDPRFANHQVHKVTQGYSPKANDELELVLGDYIYIEQKEFDNSPDGWVHGTSWLTGISGCLPAVFTKRTAEADAWTLHRAVSLGSNSRTDLKSESDSNTDGEMTSNYPHEDAANLGLEKSEESYKEWEKFWHTQTHITDGILHITQGAGADWKTNGTNGNGEVATDNALTKSKESQTENRRWLLSVRHGERIDLTYGAWTPHCFTKDGQYIRKDLNMPISLPERAGGAESYNRDTPLTRVGRLQAFLVGEALRLAGVTIAHVYSSCALRSVETAHNILQGLQDPSVLIRVEPGLFEYKPWHVSKGLGPFMTPAELSKAGYQVDVNYKPYVEMSTDCVETTDEFYGRHEKVMHGAYRDTEAEGGNILFVGHACTLDLMVTTMKRFESTDEPPPYVLNTNLLRVPYCAVGAMRDRPMTVVCPPCPPSINSSSGRFDWKSLLDA